MPWPSARSINNAYALRLGTQHQQRIRVASALCAHGKSVSLFYFPVALRKKKATLLGWCTFVARSSNNAYALRLGTQQQQRIRAASALCACAASALCA